MLKKLRRNSKAIVEARRNSSIVSPQASSIRQDSINEDKCTFFNLPPEIRNAIYEDVATHSRICLPLPTRNQSKTPPPIPGLLLASKKTRQEYLTIMLEFSPLQVVIKDFDFRNLLRIRGSLYASELKALRKNEALHIRLLLDTKGNKETLAALRRWLVDRANNLDRLPWRYDVVWTKHTQLLPTSTQVHRINTYLLRRTMLSQWLEAMSQLHYNVEEALQWELRPIIAAFEGEMMHVGKDPELPWREVTGGTVWGGSRLVGRT